MKRTSEKQLTQLSAAQEDDENGDEPAGAWQPAPAEVLAQRRIVKAHRPSSTADGKRAPAANPLANVSLVPPAAAAAPAGAPAAAGACAWSLGAKAPASFAIPPMPTSKPQPPPAACASGFFAGPGGCAWASGGGGFGGMAAGGGGFASVASSAPSFSALSKGGAPAAAEASPFSALAGPTAFAAAGGSRKPAAAEGGRGDGDADADAGVDGEDPLAHEVPIASEPKLPLVATVTGEEDEVCVHKVRAKVFVLEQGAAAGSGGAASAAAGAAADGKAGGADAGGEAAEVGKEGAGEPSGGAAAGSRWVERGVGALHLNVHRPPPNAAAPDFVPGAAAHAPSKAAKGRPPRLVMRVEHVGRLILNTPLLPGLPPPSRASETSVRINSLGTALGEDVDGSPPPAFQCLLRVKTPVEAEALMHALTRALDTAAASRG